MVCILSPRFFPLAYRSLCVHSRAMFILRKCCSKRRAEEGLQDDDFEDFDDWDDEEVAVQIDSHQPLRPRHSSSSSTPFVYSAEENSSERTASNSNGTSYLKLFRIGCAFGLFLPYKFLYRAESLTCNAHTSTRISHRIQAKGGWKTIISTASDGGDDLNRTK